MAPVTQTPPPLPGKTVWMMALTAAFAAANLYYNQPLLGEIQKTFGVKAGAVGVIPTLTQLGYALGMLLLVPLGDMLERKRLIIISLFVSAAALWLVAMSPNLPCLAAASLGLGLASMAPQLTIPFAAQLATPERRGAVLGMVMSGLLLGILLARTVSGLVGTYWGWRAMFWLGGGIMVILAGLVHWTFPRSVAQFRGSYGTLLKSVWTLMQEEPVLRESAAIGALLFAGFSAFWATLTFVLAEPPLLYGAQAAGFFGLVGAAGALAAPLVGRFADRASPRTLILINLLALTWSFAIMGWFGHSLAGLVAGVLLLDMAVQGGHVVNQTRIFALREDARSRLNTAYMFCYFMGGAAGSWLGAISWGMGGWWGVCGTQILLIGTAAIVFALRRGPAHISLARRTPARGEH